MRRLSLSTRLTALVLLTVLPALVLIAWEYREARLLEQEQARERTLLLVDRAESGHARRTEGARQLLGAVSQVPAVREGTNGDCDGFLRLLHSNFDAYANIAVVDADGQVACSAVPADTLLYLGDETFFRRAMETRSFSIGDYTMGRIVRRPVLHFGTPMLDRNSEVQRIAFVALDLSWLRSFIEDEGLPPGSTVTVVDARGRVLERHPEGAEWIGRSPEGSELVRDILSLPGRGTFAAHGLDGVPRLYAVGPLQTEGAPVFVAIGIPSDVVYAEAGAFLRRGLTGLAVVFLLTLVAIRLGGRWLVLNRLRDLGDTVREIERGDLSRRVAVTSEDELGTLARSFNAMAARVEANQRELESRIAEKTRALATTLEESEERRSTLEALLESLPIGVLLARAPGGERILLNGVGQEILGADLRAAGAVEYVEAYGLVRADGSPYPEDELPLAVTLRTGERVTKSDVCVQRPDGRIVHLRVSTAPVRNARGVMTQAVAVFEDMTEEHELEAAKDEFVGLASHQLRTPATGVKAFLSMLMDGDAGPLSDEAQAFVEQAYASNEHGLRLIEDLLAVARFETGRSPMERRDVDLREAVSATVGCQHEVVRRRGQEIDLALPGEPVHAFVDEDKIRMMVGNLLDNASKYTPEGGRVSVRLDNGRGDVTIAVSDTGVGIAPEDQPRLFRRFFRLNRPDHRVQGSGLGLYLVRKLADLHGGTVRVESEVGKGTTFVITLPRR